MSRPLNNNSMDAALWNVSVHGDYVRASQSNMNFPAVGDNQKTIERVSSWLGGKWVARLPNNLNFVSNKISTLICSYVSHSILFIQ